MSDVFAHAEHSPSIVGRAGPRWPGGLLTPDDPDPVVHRRPSSPSRILLVCDHGGRTVPSGLDLGVSKADLARHIGYDIGALALAEALSDALNAEMIAQIYSRLVVDCNRAPHVASAMPAKVDGTAVPANQPVTQGAARVAELFMPYHARITSSLDARAVRGEATVLVAVHSFTPAHSDYPGERPWPITVLYNRLPDYSLAIAQELERDGTLVGRNVPYNVNDKEDYTIPVHAERRGLASTLLEIRQDGLTTQDDVAHWTARLLEALPAALARIDAKGAPA